MRPLFFKLFSLFFLTFGSFLFAASVSQADLISQYRGLDVGRTQWLAFHVVMPPGWHTYGEKPGDVGAPPEFTWELPKGVHIEGPQFLPTKTFQALGFTQFGYEGDAVFLFRVRIDDPSLVSTTIPIRLTARWLVCKDACVPERGVFELRLPIVSGVPSVDPTSSAIILNAVAQLPSSFPILASLKKWAVILLLSFFGGLLLNVMPCVFPVVSLKLVHLVTHSTDRRKLVISSLLYSVGVMISFVSLGVLLIFLQRIGLTLGWGFQLQLPAFVAFLASLFFILALNMLGVFEWGLALTRLDSGRLNMTGVNAVFSGFLSTIVATPCAAPFLGSSIGLALTSPGVGSIAIFVAVSLGLSLPFLLITIFPGLVRFLPRSGSWMSSFKQFLAFPLLATVWWLLGVLGQQVAYLVVWQLLGWFIVIGVMFWAYGRWGTALRWSWVLVIVVLLGISFGVKLSLSPPPKSEVVWHPYSQSFLAESLASGKPVFVDFGAAWCLTCQYNERTVLSDPRVLSAFKSHHVILIRADWTNRDATITRALATFGRSSVPLYVFYRDGKTSPILLSEILRVGDVLKML